MKIYAIIPARKGSKSIRNKNITTLNNIPLIQYSVNIAKQSKLIDEVIVSSDSNQYLDIASENHKIIRHLRPKSISHDNSPDIDFFIDCIYFLKKSKIKLPDLFVHLRPTTPTRKLKVIDQAIKIMLSSKNSSLRSVHETSSTAYKYFEIRKNKLVTIFKKDNFIDLSNLARQNYNKTYMPNGYVDIIRTKNIIKYRYLHGRNVYPFITNPVIEIDSKFDLNLLKLSLEKISV